MALSVTARFAAVDSLVEAARAHRDAWIPVDAELRYQIEQGATASDLATMLTDLRLDLGIGRPSTTADVTGPGGVEISIVDICSPDYPSSLRVLDDAPLLLFIAGSLPQTPSRPALAMVGSRKASDVGCDTAHRVAAKVAQAGHAVVSGLAEGIDSAAHNGALSTGGTTVAVIGTGIDQTFPEKNATLAARIASTGAVVTQFAPGQGPSKTTFPARNALIAGLAHASLLVELSERSGTRIEANRTIEQGKPVWLWGPIMRAAPWAQQYVKHPQVDFVDDVPELLARLNGLGAHER